MLNLKNRQKFQLPAFGSRSLEFSPVPIESDGLIQEIDNPAYEKWELINAPPDAEKLQEFLLSALADTAINDFHE